MRYRSIPQEVEAVQWTGHNRSEISNFAKHNIEFDDAYPGELALLAGKEGAQGWVEVPHGHWIVRKPFDYSDYWPVDPDYFAQKYEEVI